MLRRGFARRTVALGCVAALLASCNDDPPVAFPAAVIEIETDLPVPRVLGRLQIDVYDQQGAWVESRRFPLARPTDLPTSFGVVMRDDSRATSVLVRLRGYVEGAERDYLGERFVARVPWTPPATPQTLADLCANAPELPPNETRVLTAGPKPLFKTTCEDLDNLSGSVAARVTIEKKDRYHFGLLPIFTVETNLTVAASPTLHLVRDCTKPEETLGCNVEIDDAFGATGNIELDLEPGRYALVTGAFLPTSVGDIALRWTRAAEWGAPGRPLPRAAAGDSTTEPLPLTLASGRTPATEPAPDATVDRLVRLQLRPGEPIRARVVLGGACAGTMAKLAVVNGRVDASASMTCKPASGVLEPLEMGGDAQGATRPYAEEPCADDESDDAVVCVPGGAVALGSTSASLPGRASETPQRIAGVGKFWIDRHELTVARFRAAQKEGFKTPRPAVVFAPLENEGALTQTDDNVSATFSQTRKDREDYPLNHVLWPIARDICRHFGGDLPTEVQWEHAATYGSTTKRLYPWGDAVPSCDLTVAGRLASARLCQGPALEAVTSDALARDVTALGIVGLGGNLKELVIGTPHPYDHACFRGAPNMDPVCDDPTLPGRVLRGGDWRDPPATCRTTTRGTTTNASRQGNVGFRCAYGRRPGR